MSVPEKFPEDLLDRYLTGTISEPDRKVLMDWFNSFSDETVSVASTTGRSREMIRESIWEAIEKQASLKLKASNDLLPGLEPETDLENLKPGIVQNRQDRQDGQDDQDDQLSPFRKMPSKRPVAGPVLGFMRRLGVTGIAAAVLLLMVLGWWGRNYFGAANRGPAMQAGRGLHPGSGARPLDAADQRQNHNGAILTLGDGKQVALDSTGSKEIAMQGGARILQQGGQVRYLHLKGPDGITGGGSLAKQRPDNGSSNKPAAEMVYNTMTTPRGKQFSLILPDGTKVWLNAASSITYPVVFAKDKRSVIVTGEVYFEVAHLTASDHQTRIPFDVQSGQLQVEVLGTHFAIENYPEERQIKTTLLEGSVAVRYANGPAGKTIAPGQQASLERTGSGSIAVKTVDTHQAIAWKEGLFYFKDEPLSDILRQVARWYDVDAGADPAKMKLRFSGVISKRARLADLLDVLSATGVIQFKISENKVYGY